MTRARVVDTVPSRSHSRYAAARAAIERRLARMEPGEHLALPFASPNAARSAAGRMRYWALPATVARRDTTVYLTRRWVVGQSRPQILPPPPRAP